MYRSDGSTRTPVTHVCGARRSAGAALGTAIGIRASAPGVETNGGFPPARGVTPRTTIMRGLPIDRNEPVTALESLLLGNPRVTWHFVMINLPCVSSPALLDDGGEDSSAFRGSGSAGRAVSISRPEELSTRDGSE